MLFRYGPVVYGSRCQKGEYNASVRKVMERYPKISRELAEQEIHDYLFSPTDYLAKQTPERKARARASMAQSGPRPHVWRRRAR